MLTTHTILQRRYRIVSLLAQGGMGNIYQARDMRLRLHVALKEMLSQPGVDTHKLNQLRQQFEQEATVLARLNHPHLVRVTDLFKERDSIYLVMDFVEGESLADRIERQGALPEAQVLTWAYQLLDALKYCHSQGVIHRDVKPQNVIIRSDDRAVLVDFGLVKLWDPRDPNTKAVMRGIGTPEYTPLEQYDIRGSHTDARSDLYSLGATLYHALTGQAPPTATRRSLSPETFKPVRVLNSRISARTGAAIAWALELRPEDRFQNAQEMSTALAAPPSVVDIAQAKRHFNRGVAYGKQGWLDDEIREYQAALRLKPDSARTHYQLGLAYQCQGYLDKAIHEYQAVLHINSNYAKVHYSLGLAYLQQERWDEAIGEYRSALRINPNHKEARRKLDAARRELEAKQTVKISAREPGKQRLHHTASRIAIATPQNLERLLSQQAWWKKPEFCLVPAGEFSIRSLKEA